MKSNYLRRELKKKGDYATQLPLMIERTKIQISEPHEDILSARIHPLLEVIRPMLSGTFLDVGCYGGWVYHYVKDVVDYHGIDSWKTAVDAARQFYGEEDRFELVDVRDYTKKHDIVFCAQVGPETKENEVLEHLKTLANKTLIVSGLYISADKTAEEIYGVPFKTFMWKW